MYQNDTLNYRILKPLDYDQNQQYPVHLFLHGAGERGSDNTSINVCRSSFSKKRK